MLKDLTDPIVPIIFSPLLNIAGWSSLVARWAHNPKVVGSNPTPATPLSPCQSGAYLFLGASFMHLAIPILSYC